MSKSITYSDAGVSIDAANAATEKIKRLAQQTFNERTLTEIGSFGGISTPRFRRWSGLSWSLRLTASGQN